MKLRSIKFFLVLSVLLAGNYQALCQNASRSPHNFSTNTWDYSERCNPCHVFNPGETPNAENEFLISYEKDSLASADSVYLSGISKLCFTCHDGSVASFSHTAEAEQRFSHSEISMNYHPVSVLYQSDNLRKTKLFDPNTTMSGLGGTIADDLLINGRVECTSCHNAHFSTEKTACKSCPPVPFKRGISDGSSSLWIANDKSALCLICHKI